MLKKLIRKKLAQVACVKFRYKFMQVLVHTCMEQSCVLFSARNLYMKQVRQVLYRRWKDGLASMVAPSGEYKENNANKVFS